jgi:hypothetical protein
VWYGGVYKAFSTKYQPESSEHFTNLVGVVVFKVMGTVYRVVGSMQVGSIEQFTTIFADIWFSFWVYIKKVMFPPIITIGNWDGFRISTYIKDSQ